MATLTSAYKNPELYAEIARAVKFPTLVLMEPGEKIVFHMACWLSNMGKKGGRWVFGLYAAHKLCRSWEGCINGGLGLIERSGQQSSDRPFYEDCSIILEPQPHRILSLQLTAPQLSRGIHYTGVYILPGAWIFLSVFFRFFPFPLFSSSLFPFSPFSPT